MDYKKIIAATAVTSAAFVVPAVVGAEETEKANLLGMEDNATVSVGQELIVSFQNAEGIEFESYTWTVISDGKQETLPVTAAKYKPTYSLYGNNLQVEAKVKGENKVYTHTVKVDKIDYIHANGILPSTEFFWNDEVTLTQVDKNGVKITPSVTRWLVDGVYLGNATKLKIPFGSTKIDAILVDPSGTEVYFDSINIKKPQEEIVFETTGPFKVNDTLSVNLNVAGIIKKIDWYIDMQFYKSGTDESIDIPVIASGKKINAVVTLETESNGILQYTNKDIIEVSEIVLPVPNETDKKLISKINNVDLKDIEGYTLVENDVVSVELPEFEVKLMENQMNITYEWYETNGTSLIKIPSATTNSFTIPTDTKDKKYNKYIAKVTVKIPGANISPQIYYSDTFSLEETPIIDLIAKINTLQDGLTMYIDEFQTNLQMALDQYNRLSPNAQVLVTNSAKLITAQNDLKVASPIIKALNIFKAKYDEMSAEQLEQNHKELLKEVSKIEAQYEKLTVLQQSIIKNDEKLNSELTTDFKEIKEYLNKFSADVSEDKSTTMIVTNLNNDIEALISGFGTLEGTYNFERNELKQEIEDINKRIKTVDKKYLPLIKTTIIKNAEADLKKAERAVKKIQAISTAAENKKSKAADAARIEFNKLSPLQQSLISDEEQALFVLEESDPETKVKDLVDKIDSLISGNAYNFSSEVFDEKTMTQAFEDLTNEYKVLSPADRKLVTNYAIVTQFGKDIKTATSAKKPLLALDKAMVAYYDEVDEKKQASKMKTAYSKYTAAYKAYTKLTPLQQSILTSPDFIDGLTVDFDYENYFVYGSAKEFEELLSVPEPKEGTNPEKVPTLDNAISVVKLLEGFYNGILDGNYTIDEAKVEIDLLKEAYSDLLPAEKKNVYNYSVISTVNSMISKATSAKKKLENANTEAKLVSAIAAYNKLTNPQKELIFDSYETAQSQLDTILESKPSYSAIEEQIAELQETYTLVKIEAITADLTKLTSKEQKALKNYKVYTDALKDVKAVEKFVSNVQKQGIAPTYSKIEKILKDLNKLSAKQVELLSGYTLNEANLLDEIQKWSTEMRQDANTLNEKLAKIISVGEYNSDSFESSTAQSLHIEISKFEAEYKALDSKEKKLVTNYSVIKTLKSDLKKVEPVLALAESVKSQQPDVLKQWQAAYQRLSAKQVSLYDVLGGTVF